MNTIDHKVCVAPMMQYTDMHDRYLLRLISKKVFLYTEMIATGSLVSVSYTHLRAHET